MPQHPEHSRLNVVSINPLAYQVTTHAPCICNELASLHNRHMPVTVDELGDADYRAKRLFNLPVLHDYSPVSKLSVAMAYTGAKRHVYLRALHNLREGICYKRATRVSMFIKSDKYPRGDLEGPEPKMPRAIQFRSPEFNLSIACYLKPYEHGMYETLTSPVGLRVVAKGLNNLERAANIVEASQKFARPIYVLLDHSKFDSCVTEDMLKWTHRQYLRTVKSKHLRRLLRYTINNRGTTKNGIKYKVNGGRMSGDFDTALGNTIINFATITSGVKKFKHHLLIDGDDSVLILERFDWDTFVQYTLKDHCFKMGFNTKIEVATELCQVEFCRSKLIPTNPPRFARDPIRAMSNYSVTLKDYSGDARLRYLAGIGVGEMAASAGVPIMQAYALALARAHSNPMYIEELHVAYGKPGDPLDIDPESRAMFADQWGISPAQQEAIESAIQTPTRVTTSELLRYYELLPLNKNEFTY